MSFKGKLFYAEADKGYTLKILIDSLFIVMKRTTFTIDDLGFRHCQADEACHVLFDADFPRPNFKNYYCKQPRTFSLNMHHLHKMVKNVKKKDSIIMCIEESDPGKLELKIRPAEAPEGSNFKSETVSISIKDELYESTTIPETLEHPNTGEVVCVYKHPKVVKSSDIQKMKKITTIGKVVSVAMQKDNYIKFSNNNGDLYDTKFEYGLKLDLPEDPDDGFLVAGMYSASFPVKSFTMLMKLPGLCKQMQFYAPCVKNYPLKICMLASELGTIKVHIKDTDMISQEQTQREQDIAATN